MCHCNIATFDILAEGPPWTLSLTSFGFLFEEWRVKSFDFGWNFIIESSHPNNIDQMDHYGNRWKTRWGHSVEFHFHSFIHLSLKSIKIEVHNWKISKNRNCQFYLPIQARKIDTKTNSLKIKWIWIFNYNIIFQLSFCSDNMYLS